MVFVSVVVVVFVSIVVVVFVSIVVVVSCLRFMIPLAYNIIIIIMYVAGVLSTNKVLLDYCMCFLLLVCASVCVCVCVFTNCYSYCVSVWSCLHALL